MMESGRNANTKAFTLIEMVCVTVLLAIVALLAAGRFSKTAATARIAVAKAELSAIRDAFMDSDSGLVRDLETLPGFAPASLRIANLLSPTNIWGETLSSSLPARMDALDTTRTAYRAGEGAAESGAWTGWNEAAGRGWRGPYLKSGNIGVFPARDNARPGFYPDLSNILVPPEFADPRKASAYAFTGEAALFDPWGNPYVLQVPPPQAFTNVTGTTSQERFAFARIVSAGPDGVLDTPCYEPNDTNLLSTTWNSATRRRVRLAGRNADGSASRGDDLVLFLSRNDTYEDGER